MPRPKRCEQFDPLVVSTIHATQRCVRRAFLAGVDKESGKDYSFRKEWIRRRIEALASVFAIDVLGYSVLSNHVHQILRNRPDIVAQWTDAEVAIRWLKIFPGKRLDDHLAEPTEADVQKLCQNPKRLAELRIRLSDYSWFMRALAEPIARLANKQDKCTGRFWEGRYKLQGIEDMAGLLACAVYVDLNPVRAAIAASPELSKFTSAYDRIEAAKGTEIASAAFNLQPVPTQKAGKKIVKTPLEKLRRERNSKRKNPTGKRILRDAWLAPLTLHPDKLATDAQLNSEGVRASDRGFLDMSQNDYLELLRWTARQRVADKVAEVPEAMASKLACVGIDVSMWRDLVWNWKKYFGKSTCVGRPEAMKAHAAKIGQQWHRGQNSAAVCFA